MGQPRLCHDAIHRVKSCPLRILSIIGRVRSAPNRAKHYREAVML